MLGPMRTHRCLGLALVLAGCYEADSPLGELLGDTGAGDSGADGGDSSGCQAEDTFGAVVCDRYFTPDEVPGAVAIGWIDLDSELEKLELDDIDIREDGETWQEWSITVDARSTAPGGNPVMGLTIPGAPERDAEVRIDGEVLTVDGEWFDLCDLETGVIVHIDGVEFTDHRCGLYFSVDW